MKPSSTVYSAIHPDFPSHQLDQPPRDGQSQTCPSVFPSCGCIGRSKREKYRFLLLWRNPDPSVCHGKMKNALCSIPRINDNLQRHFSLVGELNRIAYEIGDNLAYTGRIPPNDLWHLGTDIAQQFELLLIRP